MLLRKSILSYDSLIMKSNYRWVYMLNISRANKIENKIDFNQYLVAYLPCLNGFEYTKCETWYTIFYLITSTIIVFYKYQLICSNISISCTIQTPVCWATIVWVLQFLLVNKKLNTVYELCLVGSWNFTNLSIPDHECFNKVFKSNGACTQEQTFEVSNQSFYPYIMVQPNLTIIMHECFSPFLNIIYNRTKFIWYMFILGCYIYKA